MSSGANGIVENLWVSGFSLLPKLRLINSIEALLIAFVRNFRGLWPVERCPTTGVNIDQKVYPSHKFNQS
jgi:hypothetical protein